jgi:hypothetical protein
VDADVVVVGAGALVGRGLWQYAHYYDPDPSDLDLYPRTSLAGFAARSPSAVQRVEGNMHRRY